MPSLCQLLTCCWAVYCWESPTLAAEPTGILPSSDTPNSLQIDEAAIYGSMVGSPVDETAEIAGISTTSGNTKHGGRYAPLMAMHDLLHARQFSADGLLQFRYPTYLTHALLLSSAEAKAHDLQRMPLHRFASPLMASQTAEVPLATVGAPRAFHLLILFTFIDGRTDTVAEHLSSQCKDCPDALAAFRKASHAYKLSDSSLASDDALPVFFAVVNVGTRDGAAISAVHPAMQLPVVVHLPPTTGPELASEENAQYSNGVGTGPATGYSGNGGSLNAARHRILAEEFFRRALGFVEEEEKQVHELILQQERDGIHGKVQFLSLPESNLLLLQRRRNEASLEQRLLEWANTRTHREVNYASLDDAKQAQARRSGLLAMLPLLVTIVCWLAWKAMSLLRQNQWVIPAGGVVAYTLCSGGLVFSIIHSVPIAGYDEGSKRYVLLAPTSRAQYLVEGLLLACCSTVASLATLGLLRAPHFARPSTGGSSTCNDEASSTGGSPCEASFAVVGSTEMQVRWRKYFMVTSFALLATAMVVCSGLVMKCYRTKASWYEPTFWPDPNLPKGPLKVDWGNMF